MFYRQATYFELWFIMWFSVSTFNIMAIIGTMQILVVQVESLHEI